MVLKQILQFKGNKGAVFISIIIVGVFGIFQAIEIKGATTSQVTLSTTVDSTLDVSCGAPGSFGTLTPGTPAVVTTTCATTTNAANGYYLSLKRDDATGTLKNGSNYIADKTAWTSATPNGAVWSGTGIGFRVKTTGTTAGLYSSTYWGTDDTAPNAKYAGLPSAYDKIANLATYSASATSAVVEFKVDVPATQAAGSYSGTATFQVTANP